MIYTNPFGWSSVSRGYDDYFQDAHRWAREGIVDALCPMTYWRLTEPRGPRTDFATLADHHVGAANAGGRHAYMGILAEHDADEIVAQIEAARAAGARGFVLFEINALREGDRLARLADGPLSEPIAAPRYPWK